MEIRNPVAIADDRIDCEINHPAHGWIPFTADLHDVEPIGAIVYQAALAAIQQAAD
ncbi:MAG: hypothetical protein ACEQSU_14865 [Microgenomates group bacterium]